MAELVSITVALYGFLQEKEHFMKAAFANADKWLPPWELTLTVEEASVVILDLASEDDYETIEKLKRDLPNAEIVVFSSKKPPQAKWYLQRQPGGKVPIVGFSQLVLKISHSLKRNPAEVSGSQAKAISPIGQTKITTETELSSISDEEVFEQEPGDMLSFFNKLDSLLDSKPNEKRKRFNES